jgi:hypothetical protein
MVHIYHEFLRDLHSANGKWEYAQSCTPLAGFAAGAYVATLSQIEAAFDKLGHVNQDQTSTVPSFYVNLHADTCRGGALRGSLG